MHSILLLIYSGLNCMRSQKLKIPQARGILNILLICIPSCKHQKSSSTPKKQVNY